MTRLLVLGILFSTPVRTVVVVAKLVILGVSTLISFILALIEALVAKLVILGISPSTSFYIALRVVLVAKLVISGFFLQYFFILALYTSFLATSFFTKSLSLLKSTGTGTNLSKSNFILI